MQDSHLYSNTGELQEAEIKAFMDDLEPIFGSVKYVIRPEDGFEEATTQAYVRPDPVSGYEFEYTNGAEGERWLIGQYVVVAQGEADKLSSLLRVLRVHAFTVKALSRIADTIYFDETGQENQVYQNLMRVSFEIMTPENCQTVC